MLVIRLAAGPLGPDIKLAELFGTKSGFHWTRDWSKIPGTSGPYQDVTRMTHFPHLFQRVTRDQATPSPKEWDIMSTSMRALTMGLAFAGLVSAAGAQSLSSVEEQLALRLADPSGAVQSGAMLHPDAAHSRGTPNRVVV